MDWYLCQGMTVRSGVCSDCQLAPALQRWAGSQALKAVHPALGTAAEQAAAAAVDTCCSM
jgi:hypothetical protein